MSTGYSHTQRAPLHLLFWLLVGANGLLAAFAASWGAPQLVSVLALVIAVTCLALALTLRELTIRDAGETLRVRFGPLPLFGIKLRYAAMTNARVGRTSWIDGWGMHWVPGRGMTVNLWGRDCVVVQLGHRTVRLGTDDPDALASFLRGRIAGPSGTAPAAGSQGVPAPAR
jgi:hypothetical protein